MSSLKDAVLHVVCKYSFLVLIFSLFGAIQVGFIEPKMRKLLKLGHPDEHEIKTDDLTVKIVIFVVGISILFLLFKNKLIQCAAGT